MAHLVSDFNFPEFFEFMMSLGDRVRGPRRKRVRLMVCTENPWSDLRPLECWVNSATRPARHGDGWTFEGDNCQRMEDGRPSLWPQRHFRLTCKFHIHDHPIYPPHTLGEIELLEEIAESPQMLSAT